MRPYWEEKLIRQLNKYGQILGTESLKLERLEMLETRLYESKGISYSAVPNEGGGSKYEDQLIDALAEKQELEKDLKENEKYVKWIDKCLSTLEAKEKDIVWTFYVDRPSRHIDKLMEKYNIEKSQVYRDRDKATRKLALKMYGNLRG